MRKQWLLAALLLLAATACGAEGTTDTREAPDAVDTVDATLTIEAPEPGAKVQIPFTIEVATNETLGPPDSGRPSLRILIDGIEVATTNDTTFEVTRQLVPGPHNIHVSLLRPGAEQDGQPTVPGPADEVTVTVTGAGG